MDDATFFDVRGVGHTPLPATPVRLVSLVPSTTETLFALGRGADLVGYTRFCVHPAANVTQAKWIGGTKNPKIEMIRAHRPDLVLANREENRQEDIEALEAAGIPVWVAEPRTVEAAITEIEQLGAVVGRAEAGARLAAEVRAVQHPRADDAAPTAAYLIWRAPYMGAGQETFIADMLSYGGLRVPFAGRYPELSLDALHGVDVILLASEPFPFAGKHRDELIAHGIPASKIRLVDGELISWHGTRMSKGLPYVARLRESLSAARQGTTEAKEKL